MLEKAVELKVCLNALGVEISTDDFDSRLSLQKNTYLLQAFGVNLGYGFNWYIRGPYSSYLADVGFYISRDNNSVTEQTKTVKLKDWALEKINACKDFIQKSKPVNMSNLDWLELLASLHYLKNNTFNGKQAKTPKDLQDLLIKKKSWYQEPVVEYAIEKLENAGLISFS